MTFISSLSLSLLYVFSNTLPLYLSILNPQLDDRKIFKSNSCACTVRCQGKGSSGESACASDIHYCKSSRGDCDGYRIRMLGGKPHIVFFRRPSAEEEASFFIEPELLKPSFWGDASSSSYNAATHGPKVEAWSKEHIYEPGMVGSCVVSFLSFFLIISFISQAHPLLLTSGLPSSKSGSEAQRSSRKGRRSR